MMQLETAGTPPAPWLAFTDSGATERQCASQARTDEAPSNERTSQAEAADPIPYVSPPPMPWPRVFPGL